ncbi:MULTISPECIES: SOS response-associated peptidase family protein [Hyphomonas]|uniref:SOS response-associated peptidase family protein n=1 Tax=Hyphomonas TaxID=85 RepID=UPI001D6F64DB|nr:MULTISPECIES: SOS response-associated peptidase family protein [Hyphomonas]MCA8890437.1 SOS response-associated peptidase family protein [Hyphomonas sp.]|tara:strand:+ start:572 stop:1291 length:720 start_codon:yes stop_codon:yes gene_type:complete
MCGKFTYMATWAQVADFSAPLASRPSNAPEETAMPMRRAPVLHLSADAERTQTEMVWGFTRERHGRRYPDHIHARDDKLLASRLWRPHFEARRGILIVSSFNEGQEVPTYKADRVTPTGNMKTVQWTIRPKDSSRLAIAVIYRILETAEGSVPEFVMCTTPANKGIAAFVTGDPDKRMPAVLQEAGIPVWLGETGAALEQVQACLRTFEDGGAWDMQPEASLKAPSRKKSPKAEQGDLF